MSEIFDKWTVQARKGLLELCILNALEEEERYGYELVKTLVAVPGLFVSESTLYPLLSRLRVQGLVKTRLEESSEGPARKYYSLTAKGKREASVMNDHLELIVDGIRAVRRNGGSK